MIIKTEFKFLRLLLFLGLFLYSLTIFAQGNGQGLDKKNDPQTFTVTPTGSLAFGRFSIPSGGSGTITLKPAPFVPVNRTGDIILVNSPRSIVSFDISTTKGNNPMVTVTADTPTLTSPAGSLKLFVEFSENPFTLVKDQVTTIYMGGVLTVDSGDLPGYYSGTVNVIFAYQ